MGTGYDVWAIRVREGTMWERVRVTWERIGTMWECVGTSGYVWIRVREGTT